MAQPSAATRPLIAHAASDVAGVAERLAFAADEAWPCAARSLAEEARALLGSDAALVLAPGAAPGSLEVAATAPPLAGGPLAGERWCVGAAGDGLCDRAAASTGEALGAKAVLHARLLHLGLTAWEAVPIAPPDGARSLGLLVVAARGDHAPARRPEHLAPLAMSAAAALARVHPAPLRAPELQHLRRVRLLAALAFGVSHSLGNIFSSMVGNLHFLGEGATEAESVELLAGLERSAVTGAELMQALQTIAALPADAEMGPVDLVTVACEVAALTSGVCRPWPSLAEVAVRVEGQEPCLAWGNRAQLSEALVRMVFNAVQAAGPTARVVLAAHGTRDEARLSVRDDGPGMSPEVARRACEPFFTTRPAPHQGLGLTIARGIAVAHRGALKLKRSPSGGTEATLTVAREKPESDAAGDAWTRRNRGPGGEGPAPRGAVGVTP